MALKQFHEVAVLGQDNGAGSPCGSKDIRIFGVPKAKVPHSVRVELKAHPQPNRDGRRKLCIQPESHATTTG